MSVDTYHYHSKPGRDALTPLVVTFHGTGGDEFQFSGLIDQLMPDAALLSPRGDVQEHGANRFFRRKAEGQYDMQDLAQRTTRMISFLAAHKAENPDRPIYGLGYSNGANILASVLFQAPELFDRAVLMHPLIPFTPAPQPGLKDKAVLITAGRRDPICPLPQSEALACWFQDQGSKLDFAVQNGGHEVGQAELAQIGDFLRRN
ncbi:alpha/beta hydrolase [Paracoccus sp. (in: a-proteobacteria)]|uniref:alpha/beta hydrolase n=1 Tax=Paracoccus sp. TaxID=267 RepID=UPI002896CD7D|nr:alpha/beta hydrolase [Paracoccus sp. (in: a-proteobacteria)]